MIPEKIKILIIEEALRLGAIIVNPTNPFKWAGGDKMPLYNNNRILLKDPMVWTLVIVALREMLREIGHYDAIAGVATAGIPHASVLASTEGKRLLYVRSEAKGHGLGLQVEGISIGERLDGQTGIMIEDLISTGGSSVKAVEALQALGAKVPYCLSIFSYGFKVARAEFDKVGCVPMSVFTYDDLLPFLKKSGKFDNVQMLALEEWSQDPFGWGENHGFPKEEK